MDTIKFCGYKDKLSDNLKERYSYNINHFTLFNPYSQSELVHSLQIFEDKIDHSQKKMNNNISGIKDDISCIKRDISDIITDLKKLNKTCGVIQSKLT